MTELKITQADRDAANRLMEIWDDGDLHCDNFVEAFARHRIAVEEGIIAGIEQMYDNGDSIDGLLVNNDLRAALARVRGEG